MTKIRSLTIDGLRGVRKKLPLSLDTKSALLYGDNGTGKSTISDVIEWFYNDKVEHLVGEEIGRKGYEALRNIYLDDEDSASAELSFDNSKFDCTKSIEVAGTKLKATLSNASPEFKEYITKSGDENLVLRYKDLLRFIISTKGDKLRELSDIIGFSDVTKTRDVLKKVSNQLSRDIINRGFANQISHQQSQILDQFGQNVTTDKEFIKVVNELIKDFGLGVKVSSLSDVNSVLKKMKKPDNSKELKQEGLLAKLEENLISFPANLDQLENAYKDYKGRFVDIVSDLDKIKKLALEQLLRAGQDVLVKKKYDEANCPLCLQTKGPDDLIKEIDVRIVELEETRKEDRELRDARDVLTRQIASSQRLLQTTTSDKQIDLPENEERKKIALALVEKINEYKKAAGIEVEKDSVLPDEASLLIDRGPISALASSSKSELEAIRKARTVDPKWDAQSKIRIAGHAYAEIRKLSAEQAIFEKQRDALDEIYTRFVQAQKAGLKHFLANYSSRIDEIYQFLNPDERVENINLVPIEKDGDLIGLTIEYDFLDSKSTSPPHKYLSESHLNCLGLALFLSSVEAFNKLNKFIILDDVISSFDTGHRKRFADLIIEEFSDYQVILLTHEISWFEIVRNMAKQKGWHIDSIRYNDADGTHLSEPPKTLKETIELRLAAGDKSGVGNDARKYLENLLKRIAYNLEVKVAYQPNERNENRMSYELLTELKAKLKKRKCNELLSSKLIERLKNSTNIGNKDSHDHYSEMAFGDIESFWKDIVDFEELFFCKECESLVSIANYDSVDKTIRCRKAHLVYSWIS